VLVLGMEQQRVCDSYACRGLCENDGEVAACTWLPMQAAGKRDSAATERNGSKREGILSAN